MLFYLIFTPLFVITFNQTEKLIDYVTSGNSYFTESTITAFNTEKDILTKKYRIVNLAKSLLLGLMSFNSFILLINVIFFPGDVDYLLIEVFFMKEEQINY